MRGTMIAATVAALLAGCSTYDSITQKIAQSITPYRITVVQGNFVSQEAASQMQVGMSRDQVKQILGTPLLTDMFHADRWDYVFYFKRGSTSVVQQRDFVVNFASERVVSWSGGENLPSNLELLAEIDGDKGVKVAKAAVPPASAPVAASTVAVTAPAGEPSTQPNAAAAFSGDANQQAAQAANRATAQVDTPTGRQRSSAYSSAPQSAGGAPGSAGAGGSNSQIQLQRKPQQINIPDSSAVGPASTSPTPSNAGGQTQFSMPQ
ncbi:outer membrane protein assembly factor BamE [Caballeronia sp. LP006]|uniref:outer membrane protein assembly factor BamE n=1 Tax=unclassified Caballeronia TaxID=2646786 RepID=UPI00202813C5|nr:MULTISPECIES: outer membrane protein assembly factor BamE [unclassified Caballeronia]MDR5772512.1 outer membrane protein assembly factor BamE [Caballeronia sp. LZ002]MDR5832105.1 outer membrane protein assembly factor BamE [Caballeronia sp. LP006]MDR5847946.1 outer membrane protein assembly factor BamE [Caballeronia sp. LZ003]